MRAVFATALITVCALLGVAVASAGGGSPSPRPGALPPIKHVFTIVLENKNASKTFAPDSPAPYLAHTLTAKGELLTNYFGTGHYSLGNYITLISGQSENPDTQADCHTFSDLTPGTIGADGQAVGTGCVYPPNVDTVGNQLTDAGLRWRAYAEDMGLDPARDGSSTCSHPDIGATDVTQGASPTDQYATRHNPFVYFHSVIDDAYYCDKNVVALDRLSADLAKKPKKAPSYSFIVPDLCSDGHDATCAGPAQAGGYEGIDAFLKVWVPKILKSKAYKDNGMLAIVFDESEDQGDSCCFTPTGPNTLLQGVSGPGGGATGAVILSSFVKKGTINAIPYNHYNLLHTVESVFGLKYLGYAARPEVVNFGRDVFNNPKAK
jgi:phosphatidylinositol-3-phosphatase